MHIRPKHIIVLIIMIFTSTFLLDSFEVLKEANSVSYSAFQYIKAGFPAANSISNMDNHARVALYFYLFLATLVTVVYFVKNKVIKLFPVGIIITASIILSIFLLFANMQVATFFWVNVFAPLIVGLTYGLVIFLWRYEFPEIKFRKSKAFSEVEA